MSESETGSAFSLVLFLTEHEEVKCATKDRTKDSVVRRREMTKSKLLFIFVWMLVLGMIASLPRVASALQIVGEPIEGNSWSQYFRESGVGSFDRIEVIRETGDGFKIPGFSDFSESGWTVASMDERYVLGIGTAVESLEWKISFPGDLWEPFSFCFRAWHGKILRECAWIHNNGSGCSIPDASMVWLLGSAFVGFAVFGMKKSKSTAI